MKKFSILAALVAAMAVAVPVATADELVVADPVGVFTDGQGNKGYIEADSDEAVIRLCNENEATPAGDQATGYIWLSQNGESTEPTYGNANIGAGDADGEGADDGDDTNGTEGDDCPAHGGSDV